MMQESGKRANQGGKTVEQRLGQRKGEWREQKREGLAFEELEEGKAVLDKGN